MEEKKLRKVISMPYKDTLRYVRTLNGLFGLTDKEMNILSAIIDKKTSLEGTGLDVFSTEVKRIVSKELEIGNENTLNVYIKRLKDKRALHYRDKKYHINSLYENHDKVYEVVIKWT